MATIASSSRCPSIQGDAALSPAQLRRICLALVGLGVLWRLVRYGLRLPIWGDEAFVCVNFLAGDYAALTGPLKCGQVAPLLFLWGELTAYKLLGGSELSIRFLPMLASLLSLGLFWRLSWRTLSPLAATFAVGFLAVAYAPVAMSTTVKPYSLDLLMALALTVCAFEWMERPDRSAWLWLLTGLCPVAIFSSYPAVFIAGGVSVALLPTVWRQTGWTSRLLYGLFNVGMVCAFAAHVGLIGANQLRSGDGLAAAHMQDCWVDGFPPAHPWDFATWLVRIHAGRMSAYPLGDSDGGSAFTLLCALVGLSVMIRREGCSGRLLLLLVPFALNFVAAVLHKYPYGGCWRLSQHMAPGICWLAGWGLAHGIEITSWSPRIQFWQVAGISGVLAVVPIAGLARDCLRPYKDVGCYSARANVADIFAQAPADSRFLILNLRGDIDPVSYWHLSRYGERVRWYDEAGPRALESNCEVWGLRFKVFPGPGAASLSPDQVEKMCAEPAPPEPTDDGWRLGQRMPMCVEVYRWSPQERLWKEVRGEWQRGLDRR